MNVRESCENHAEITGRPRDTIYRQAAIDYFVTNVGFHDEDGYPVEDSDELRKIWTEYFDGIPSAQSEVTEEAVIEYCRKRCLCIVDSALLKKYASAQPEIIWCKNCKHRPFDGEDTQGLGVEFPDERCPCQCADGWYNWRPNNEWFCGNAERGGTR